jgi:hypothetical protein
MSMMIGLNEVEEGETGGAIRFAQLGLAVQLQLGDALLFDNYDAHGAEDQRTLHSCEPPLVSDRFTLTAWVRAAPYAAFSTEVDVQKEMLVKQIAAEASRVALLKGDEALPSARDLPSGLKRSDQAAVQATGGLSRS